MAKSFFDIFEQLYPNDSVIVVKTESAKHQEVSNVPPVEQTTEIEEVAEVETTIEENDVITIDNSYTIIYNSYILPCR